MQKKVQFSAVGVCMPHPSTAILYPIDQQETEVRECDTIRYSQRSGGEGALYISITSHPPASPRLARHHGVVNYLFPTSEISYIAVRTLCRFLLLLLLPIRRPTYVLNRKEKLIDRVYRSVEVLSLSSTIADCPTNERTSTHAVGGGGGGGE